MSIITIFFSVFSKCCKLLLLSSLLCVKWSVVFINLQFEDWKFKCMFHGTICIFLSNTIIPTTSATRHYNLKGQFWKYIHGVSRFNLQITRKLFCYMKKYFRQEIFMNSFEETNTSTFTFFYIWTVCTFINKISVSVTFDTRITDD